MSNTITAAYPKVNQFLANDLVQLLNADESVVRVVGGKTTITATYVGDIPKLDEAAIASAFAAAGIQNTLVRS